MRVFLFFFALFFAPPAFASDLTLEVTCATCRVNTVFDLKATVTDDDDDPVLGEILFYRVADGGAVTDLAETSATNSSGITHIYYTPTAVGEALVNVELEDGTAQTVTLTVAP